MKDTIIKNLLLKGISKLLSLKKKKNIDKWSDQFPHIKYTGDIPGKCSYENISKKNYKGKYKSYSQYLFWNKNK